MATIDNKSRRSYTRESVRYDERRFRHRSGQLYESLANETIWAIIQKYLNNNTKLHLLDVATGTGRAALGLAQRGSRIVALDLTEQMLRRGIVKAEQQGLKDRIDFIIANALYLPLKKAIFDGGVSLRFFHLLPPAEHKAFIREITRVLKPGSIIIIEFNNRFAGFIWSYLAEFYRQEFLGKKPKTFLYPHQIDQRFIGLSIIEKWGIWLPGTGWILRLSKNLARFLNRLTRHAPFCYLANQILIVARV